MPAARSRSRTARSWATRAWPIRRSSADRDPNKTLEGRTMLLKDKVVVISGVGPGLGRKLTLLCVKEGAKVGIGCRNTTFLNDLTEEGKAMGGQIVSAPLDVTSNARCAGLAEATAKALGRIDGRANSAYQYAPGTFEDVALDAWTGAMDVTC